jgi:hypothetical protein
VRSMPSLVPKVQSAGQILNRLLANCRCRRGAPALVAGLFEQLPQLGLNGRDLGLELVAVVVLVRSKGDPPRASRQQRVMTMTARRLALKTTTRQPLLRNHRWPVPDGSAPRRSTRLRGPARRRCRGGPRQRAGRRTPEVWSGQMARRSAAPPSPANTAQAPASAPRSRPAARAQAAGPTDWTGPPPTRRSARLSRWQWSWSELTRNAIHRTQRRPIR